MRILNRLPGFPAVAPGWERTFLRHLPATFILGSIALSLPSLAVRLSDEAASFRTVLDADIWVASLLVLHWTVLLTGGLLAAIVAVAKGPGYVADGYELNDADSPAQARLSAAETERKPKT